MFVFVDLSDVKSWYNIYMDGVESITHLIPDLDPVTARVVNVYGVANGSGTPMSIDAEG
jgi:hypothetical protein